MRFLLYNIRYGTGRRVRWGWFDTLRRTSSHLEDIARFMAACRPDVVGLVEMDSGSYRSRRRNQAEVLAERLGHYHAFQVKYRERGLFTRLPILSTQANAFLSRDVIHNEIFHYFERGCKRLVIELELEKVNLFLVHLALFFRTRQHQLADLHDLVLGSDKPCIVAGDFNVFAGEREIRLFMKATGLRSVNAAQRPTYPSWAPWRELDFIMHSPGLRVRRFRMPPVRLSDHLPLLCDFDLDL